MKTKMLSLLLAAFFGAALSIQAQGENPSRRSGRPGSAQVADNMARRLKLDDAATAWFVPIYKEYQDTLAALRKSLRPQPVRKGLSDAEALQQVENSFRLSESEVALKRSYFDRFKERLTPQQLLTVFAAPSRERGQRMPPQGGRPMGGRGGQFGGGFPGDVD